MTAAVRALLAAVYTPLLVAATVPPVTVVTLLLVPAYSWQGPLLAFALGGVCGAVGGLAEEHVLDWAVPQLTLAFTPLLPPSGGTPETGGQSRPQDGRIAP